MLAIHLLVERVLLVVETIVWQLSLLGSTTILQYFDRSWKVNLAFEELLRLDLVDLGSGIPVCGHAFVVELDRVVIWTFAKRLAVWYVHWVRLTAVRQRLLGLQFLLVKVWYVAVVRILIHLRVRSLDVFFFVCRPRQKQFCFSRVLQLTVVSICTRHGSINFSRDFRTFHLSMSGLDCSHFIWLLYFDQVCPTDRQRLVMVRRSTWLRSISENFKVCNALSDCESARSSFIGLLASLLGSSVLNEGVHTSRAILEVLDLVSFGTVFALL